MMLKSILLKTKFYFGVFVLSYACWAQADFNFQSAIAMHGTPKYAPDFTAFDYVRTDVPDTGTLRQAVIGSFDTFNPFSINGVAPAGIGLMYDTLMKSSADEPFSLYGLIAEGIALLPDDAGVAFRIRPEARFSDNTPVTAEDVAFSFQILKEKGVPTYRYYYHDVERTEVLDDQTVVFYFKPNAQNRELPFILGELPVLSKKDWQNKEFDKTSLVAPVASGPYVIDSFHQGRDITYRRRPDYWGRTLNVNRGFYHFDKLVYDYYRDTTVALEAFKAGVVDLRQENEAKKWAQFKDEETVHNKKVEMVSFAHQMPSGMQGFVFNLRRPIFADIRVRQALALAFDFDWMNRHLFYNLYRRTQSFFDNSYLKAPEKKSKVEQRVWQDLAQKELYPQAAQYGLRYEHLSMRERLKMSMSLLNMAGWQVKKGILKNRKNNPFVFEILLEAGSSGTWERIVLPFVGQLKRLGIEVRIRTVDAIQYKNRLDSFDYDMIVAVWGQSLSPGNEQRYFWGSIAADSEGAMNYSGLKSPVVDELIAHVTQAQTPDELTGAVHALDRELLANQIVIPHWYSDKLRYLIWSSVHYPSQTPMKGPDVMTWWKE